MFCLLQQTHERESASCFTKTRNVIIGGEVGRIQFNIAISAFYNSVHKEPIRKKADALATPQEGARGAQK